MTRATMDSHGALVISLDFELHWGVRDRHPPQSAYSYNLYGARTVVPRLLELFEEFGIAATWGTVGFMFANSREDLLGAAPRLRPAYRDSNLSPYEEQIGIDERDDPLHFAPSLIQRIQRTPRQEIATHTFSHYYCAEAGQSRATFEADLSAACAIAGRLGIRPRSIVFPRNQHNPDYDDILLANGIQAYRGNPPNRIWQFTDAADGARRWKRLGRMADTYFEVTGYGTFDWQEVPQTSGLSDVRATCLLRPYDPRLRHLERLRLERIRRSIRYAARTGRIVHLWTHPHNFGKHQAENLNFLRCVLTEFASCRERWGMQSFSMAGVHDRVQERSGAAGKPKRSRSGAIA